MVWPERMPDTASMHAREILDSQGNPTIEVDVRLTDGPQPRTAGDGCFTSAARGTGRRVERKGR